MKRKRYDLILVGASGFTGRLVAEYLLKEYGFDNQLRWAVAGRNITKLKKIMVDLGGSDIPVLLADNLDEKSLDKLVQQTNVICSTVGPYAQYGSLLVEACVEHSVDYCDLTGEVQWIRRMIDRHHTVAINKGVKIVHCCGFDSIPSEMGVYFLQKSAMEKYGHYAHEIKMGVRAVKGGPSGGTIASLNNVLDEAKNDPSIFKLLENPYGLNPTGEQVGNDQPDLNKAIYDNDFKNWTGPFIMAAINTKVVRRSHALANYPYGNNFRYSEVTLCGNGFGGKIKAQILAKIMSAMSSPDSMLKNISGRFLPKPGEGPNKRQRETGFYNLLFMGKLGHGNSIKVKVTGDRDPGYGSTSKMLGESAVCLALDKNKLPNVSGVITPSIAMGETLLNRLENNAGLTFSIVE